MIQTVTLSPGVTLRCFRDDRFKQGCLSLQLMRPLCHREAALNALLPAVLLRGTQRYPDLQQITLRLDQLYGASTGALVRKVGDYQSTGIYFSFLQDRYALAGGDILASVVELLEQLLFYPVLQEGLLSQAFVQSEQRNLILAIQAQRNDKRQYAAAQLLQHMCSQDPTGIPRLGREEQVAAITARSLTDHYHHILRTSPVELFYVGPQEPEQLAALLSPLAVRLAQQPLQLPPQTPFRDPPGGEHTQYLEVSQGKLCLGFVTPITLGSEEFAAMQVLNALFGGGMTSKLFTHLREKLSLCYDIGSGYRGSKGILSVSAGIDFDQLEPVKAQVLQLLEQCRQGQFTQQELENARQGLVTQLQSVHDSAGAIENYYATGLMSGLALSPEEYIQKLNAVTARQVSRAAGTLTLHTQYFLRGDRP